MQDLRRHLNTTLIAQLFFWLPVIAAAQDYHVEMLFFARTDPDAAQAEYWPNDGPPPSIEQAVALDRPQAAGFSSQSSSTFSLTTARQILEESPQYEVVEHLAWRQPGLSEAQAKSVHIQAGPDYRQMFPERTRLRRGHSSFGNTSENVYRPGPLPRLDGTVTVSLGRYLHVYTDLIYRQPVDARDEAGRRQSLIEARVQHERRMRSGDLHYLDHPLLGILVQITPVE